MTKQFKYILIAISALVALIIGVVIYRMFFQFDWDEIGVYVREEAAKYSDPTEAASLINDGIEHILCSHNLTQQVMSFSRATKTDKEQVLVTAAINQCISNNYLPGVTN